MTYVYCSSVYTGEFSNYYHSGEGIMKELTGTAVCNGYDVFYRMTEGNSGTAMLCVHGAAGDSRLFTYQLKGLGGTHTVVSVDLPGHGGSGSPEKLTVEEYRDAVLAVADALSLTSVVLVGHSMGGGVLFELYRAAPHRIKGLVFISTAPELPVNDMILDFIEKDFNSFCTMVVDLTYSPEADIALKKLAVEEVKKAGAKTVKSDFFICKNYKYSELAGTLEVPVLLLANRKDKMVPVDLVEQFASSVQGAKIIVYEARGHMPYLEDAARVNNDIAEFIQSLS